MDRLYPKKGQKTFKVNIDTLEVSEAQFTKEAIVLTAQSFKAKGKKKDLNPIRRKIIVEDRHYYCVALNKQNALRKYQQALQEYLQSITIQTNNNE